MAVNKRLRFEVLRRDGFRCTYCGATPSESELHVDHVVPTALGGTGIPENLTTSCADCNSGEASTSPSGEMVAAVNEAVAIAVAAQKRAAEQVADEMDLLDDYEKTVMDIWEHYVPSYRLQQIGTPDLSAIAQWHAQAAPLTLVEFAVRLAVQAERVPWHGKAGYAIAIVRNKMQEAGRAENSDDQT